VVPVSKYKVTRIKEKSKSPYSFQEEYFKEGGNEIFLETFPNSQKY
jgi:hypothetical protein